MGKSNYGLETGSQIMRRLAWAAVSGLTALVALFGIPALAQAATSTATFSVTATVLTSCQLSATNMAFGNYSTVDIDLTSTITVTCNELIAVGAAHIGLDPGQGSGATVSTRKMTGPGGATLNYSLFRDSARTQNWGNTVGTDTYDGLIVTALGLPVNVTVYGRLPATQYVTPGSYTDTVTVTLTY